MSSAVKDRSGLYSNLVTIALRRMAYSGSWLAGLHLIASSYSLGIALLLSQAYKPSERYMIPTVTFFSVVSPSFSTGSKIVSLLNGSRMFTTSPISGRNPRGSANPFSSYFSQRSMSFRFIGRFMVDRLQSDLSYLRPRHSIVRAFLFITHTIVNPNVSASFQLGSNESRSGAATVIQDDCIPVSVSTDCVAQQINRFFQWRGALRTGGV